MHNGNAKLAGIDIAELAARNIISQLVRDTNSCAVLNLWNDYTHISIYIDKDVYLNRSSSIALANDVF